MIYFFLNHLLFVLWGVEESAHWLGMAWTFNPPQIISETKAERSQPCDALVIPSGPFLASIIDV